MEDVAEAFLAGFSATWLSMNAYNFYAMGKYRAKGYLGSEEEAVSEDETSEFDFVYTDFELPSQIDMLLPAYDEAHVLVYSVESIAEQDLPYDVDVNLEVLLEPDDADTIHAAERLSEEMDIMSVNIVPEDFPGDPMKPRALNYGFNISDGDIVGVVDAEDVFDESILREVTESLYRDGNDYAQGVLDMVNEEDGWLNTLFRGEYGFWFRNLLESYEGSGYPVPLGGTTNFFKRDVLEEISEDRVEEIDDFWEEYDIDERFWAFSEGFDEMPWPNQNVTEDFYLGLWAWKEDYDFDYLDSITEEESPTDISSWMKQRTRWQKGKLQTLSSFRDHEIEGLSEKAHIYGQSAVPHLGPINAVGTAAGIGSYASGFPEFGAILSATMGLNFAAVGAYTGLQAKGYSDATDREGIKKYGKAAVNGITLPLYWSLQWAADARAIKQYLSSDKNWEKTDHQGRHVEED